MTSTPSVWNKRSDIERQTIAYEWLWGVPLKEISFWHKMAHSTVMKIVNRYLEPEFNF